MHKYLFIKLKCDVYSSHFIATLKLNTKATNPKNLMSLKIALVDDHLMFREAIGMFLSVKGFEVLFDAANGQELIEKIDSTNLPQIVLMDISMPVMDGYQTTKWLTKKYPSINVIALSMYNDEQSIIKMIRSGAKGFILKENAAKEILTAVEIISEKGFYYSDLVKENLIKSFQKTDIDSANKKNELRENEVEFLGYCCTDLNYNQIATTMQLSPRTIEGYRDNLFVKLNVKSRVGLAVYAIKHGFYKI